MQDQHCCQTFSTGYRSWRRVVLRALSMKSKTCFINGKIMKPDVDDPSFAHWERCDDMVTSWILNSLSPKLRDGRHYVNNVRELWEESEDCYDQTNGCKLYQLQKEINDLVQVTLDVIGYYTKMKKLWEEMNTINITSQCTCVCICGGKKQNAKGWTRQETYTFSDGFEWSVYCSKGRYPDDQWTTKNDTSFPYIIPKERQREVKPHNHTVLDSISPTTSAPTSMEKVQDKFFFYS